MPLHDWTRVGAGTFHDFHQAWITHLKEALNDGMLPTGYYAQGEQQAGRKVGDVVALHASDPDQMPALPVPVQGTCVVTEMPPRVSRTLLLKRTPMRRTRRLVVRHASGDRIIALVEIVSSGNKASKTALDEFLQKAVQAINAGIHLVVIDLLPPGRLDPQGLHALTESELSGEEYELPAPGVRTFVSYDAGIDPIAYLEHPALSDEIPDLPLFLAPEHYVTLPLAAIYATAYRGVPGRWRDVIEGK